MIETEFNIGALHLAALDNQGAGKVVLGLHGYLDNAELTAVSTLPTDSLALLR